MNKKVLLLLIITTAMLSICGCEIYIFNGIYEKDGEIIVVGHNEMNRQMTIERGTKIIFKRSLTTSESCIEFLGNGSLIAQGTAEEPIVFEGEGKGTITYVPPAIGVGEFILDHCLFEELRNDIFCPNPTTIEYCKFKNTGVKTCPGFSGSIQYSTFQITNNRISIWIQESSSTAKIQYNDIEGGQKGMYLSHPPESIIGYNNITNCTEEAIYSWVYDYTVNNNYIANSNGKSGVDTTGEQCYNIIFGSYLTTPIEDAGCGW